MSQSEKMPTPNSAVPAGPVTFSVSVTDKSQFDKLTSFMATMKEEAIAASEPVSRPMAAAPSTAPAQPSAGFTPTEPPPAPGQAGPASDEQGSERVTIYTSLDQVFQIEDVRLAFKRNYRMKLTKSRLMATMLEVAIEDFLKHGRSSLLGQRLLDEEAAR